MSKHITDLIPAQDVGWLLLYSDGSSSHILKKQHPCQRSKEALDILDYMRILHRNKAKFKDDYAAKQYEICLDIHAWAEEVCVNEALEETKK